MWLSDDKRRNTVSATVLRRDHLGGAAMALSGTVRRTLDAILGRRLAYSAHLYLEMRYHDIFGPNKQIWEKPLIFIHIPKAAGSSILKTGVAYTRGHVPYSFYERWLPDGKNMPDTFAIVRNPYDRFVSAFKYLQEADVNHIDLSYRKRFIGKGECIDAFVEKFAREERMRNFLHFLPQTHFITNSKNRIAVSEILRFEELFTHWGDFAKRHKLRVEIGNEKTSRGEKPILSDESRGIISSLYSHDFSRLNYEP